LFAGGILLTCILIARKVPGAIILSMGIVTVAGLFARRQWWESHVTADGMDLLARVLGTNVSQAQF
jgi:xanthine/uracil/vitamin C permease (AzgA family)